MISIKLPMSTIESVDQVYKSGDKNIDLKIQVQWNEILIVFYCTSTLPFPIAVQMNEIPCNE